jgi:phosphoribosyl 1,2-cyclic phosphodiesterase
MRLEFLGTAAAEGFPNPFCDCGNCQAARDEGGPSLRARSSALVNDELLIDLGPDLLTSIQRRGRSITAVKWAIQTHAHSDHLEQGSLFMRSRQCRPVDAQPVVYHCASTVVSRLDHLLMAEERHLSLGEAEVQDRYQLAIDMISPWESRSFGDYDLQTVKASHDDPALMTMVHAIRDRRSGRSLFYCTDTGPLQEGTWMRLAALGWAFDIIAIDFTFGFAGRSSGHLNVEQVLEELGAGREAGAITGSTRVFATHIGHHSAPRHSDIVERCGPLGIEVAFDGLAIEIA